MAMHQELLSRFGRAGVRLWLDVDYTRIPWGQGRRQAHLTRDFFAKLEGEDMPALAHPIASLRRIPGYSKWRTSTHMPWPIANAG